jgi:hypothetical protein
VPGPLAVTRRRALTLGAAAGLPLIVRTPADGWAATTAQPRAFGLDVPFSAWSRGGGRATGVLRAPRRFELLGLRGRGLSGADVEVRVRRSGGAWSPWTPFGVGVEHAPDRPRVAGASDPVWAGGADELQLRARRAPRGLRVHFVAVGRPAALRTATLRAAGRGADGGPPAIIPRAQWGGDSVRPRDKPEYGDVQMAFVHHTVSANQYSAEDSAGIVLAIAKYHRDTNGWNDIGYNLLVDQFGQVFEGRAGGVDLAVIGAQAQGWNTHSTGIATIGTFSDVAFPEAGVAALARVLAWKLSLHQVPTTGTVEIVSAGGAANRYRSGDPVVHQRISGHRDGCTTSCPGNALYRQLGDLRARAARLGGSTAAQPRLTLASLAKEVAYGSGAAFTGALLGGDGAPVPGTPIALQKQSGSRFVTVGQSVTRDDGSWEVTVPWRRGAAVRALATVAGSPVRSSPVSVAVGTVVEVAPVAARVLKGRSAVVTGKVRPGGPVRLRVERRIPGGGWARVAELAATVRGGRFTAKVPLRTPGLYRLTVRAGTRAKPVVAAAVLVRVVRSQASVARASGGAAPTPPAPSPAAGGATAG